MVAERKLFFLKINMINYAVESRAHAAVTPVSDKTNLHTKLIVTKNRLLNISNIVSCADCSRT